MLGFTHKVRMVSPLGNGPYPAKGGRSYYTSPGQAAEVFPEDVEALRAQGWSQIQAPPLPPTLEELRRRQQASEQASWRKLPPGGPLAWLIPPMSGPFVTLSIEGRTYTGRQGQAQAIPLEDARILARNGWLMLGHAALPSGRPVSPQRGELCVDLLEGKRVLMFDGDAWRDALTGAVV